LLWSTHGWSFIAISPFEFKVGWKSWAYFYYYRPWEKSESPSQWQSGVDGWHVRSYEGKWKHKPYPTSCL
jgi:hypothetical protein